MQLLLMQCKAVPRSSSLICAHIMSLCPHFSSISTALDTQSSNPLSTVNCYGKARMLHTSGIHSTWVQVCVPLPPWAVRAGARETIYHDPSTVNAAIVTCGGLCPGLNDVVQGLVRKLEDYGVPDGNILGIRSDMTTEPRLLPAWPDCLVSFQQNMLAMTVSSESKWLVNRSQDPHLLTLMKWLDGGACIQRTRQSFSLHGIHPLCNLGRICCRFACHCLLCLHTPTACSPIAHSHELVRSSAVEILTATACHS